MSRNTFLSGKMKLSHFSVSKTNGLASLQTCDVTYSRDLPAAATSSSC